MADKLPRNIPPGGVAPELEASPEVAAAPVVAVTTPEKTVRIVLEDTGDIPPTGQFVGYNGRSFHIRPGAEVNVPIGVLEILENAVIYVPRKDPMTLRYVSGSPRQRFPFRLVRERTAA